MTSVTGDTIKTLDLPLHEYRRSFTRTDERQQRTPWAIPHYVTVARRWMLRVAEREAARRGDGLAHTMPAVEVERRADLRGTTYDAYIDAAFTPDRPGERLIVEEGLRRISIPVAPKGVHLA